MIRENKFRSWNQEVGYFVYFCNGEYFYYSFGKKMELSGLSFSWDNAEQYTERADDNGKETFEGDTIRIEDDFSEDIFEKQIIFKDGCFLASESGVLCHISYFEIIGNIHEGDLNESNKD